MNRLLVVFSESSAKKTHHGNVQTVEPDHRLAAFGFSRVAMVMPGPGGCDDEVAGLHGRAFAVDCRKRPATFDDKAQRRLTVAMAWGDLTRQDHL
ncbi:hypothetical protein D3C71_1696300 [compost metagenome]